VERLLSRLALANLVANIVIVVTGGAVRLTGSGLGCPTWPRCTEASYVAHGALGIHGAIEFGNRTLTFVLALLALALWIVAIVGIVRAFRAKRLRAWRSFVLATVVFLGIPAQAVIGGITVRTHLNPWIVAFHLLVSMAIIGVCVALVDHLDGPARPAAIERSRRLAWLVFAAGWGVLYLGTVVTGSGPHAGDEKAHRTGLDPQVFSWVHAVAAFALVATTIGLLAVARKQGEQRLAQVAALLLLIEVAQGVVGFAQYFLGLPVALVALHMLGAALLAAGLARAVLTTRARAIA
jgi:cytochrome c oxidase assembly protein subunit 15